MKWLITIGIIILIIALGVIGFLFFRSDTGDIPGFDEFLPFGFPNLDQDSSFGGGDNERESIVFDDTERALPKLRQISQVATAGATLFEKENGNGENSLFARHIERTTGHVYETEISTMESGRISNTTIPKIYEALWGNEDTLLLRYLDEDKQTIKTFSAEITKDEEQEEGSIAGEFLTNNISFLSVSPDKKDIFYLLEESGVVGIISDFSGENKTQVFTFDFTEWLPQWSSAGIYLATKPSGGIPGFIYKLNTRDGSLNKILGDVVGLTTLISPDGDKLIYSTSGKSGVLSGIYNIGAKEFSSFPVTTFPEKCVWSEDNKTAYCGVPKNITQERSPDHWYMGLTTFSDNIWKIDTESGSGELLVDPEELAGARIDVIKLELDENEEMLLFTNKKDLHVWVFDLKQ